MLFVENYAMIAIDQEQPQKLMKQKSRNFYNSIANGSVSGIVGSAVAFNKAEEKLIIMTAFDYENQ